MEAEGKGGREVEGQRGRGAEREIIDTNSLLSIPHFLLPKSASEFIAPLEEMDFRADFL